MASKCVCVCTFVRRAQIAVLLCSPCLLADSFQTRSISSKINRLSRAKLHSVALHGAAPELQTPKQWLGRAVVRRKGEQQMEKIPIAAGEEQ
jgi:hypothetical protein